jgi:hypothetical protein
MINNNTTKIHKKVGKNKRFSNFLPPKLGIFPHFLTISSLLRSPINTGLSAKRVRK